LARIFAPIANNNWENDNLIAGLVQCGHDVIQYDWKANGYDQYRPDWSYEGKRMMNDDLLSVFKRHHKEKPFDLMFGYLSDPVIYSYVIQEIKNHGVYTINYSCNNIASFERTHLNTAVVYDCNFYSERDIEHKFKSINANSYWFPFGANIDFYHRSECNQVYDVGFVGQWYGYRLPLMATLPQYGFSTILASKVRYAELIEIIHTTKVIVGFKGLGNSAFNDTDMKQMRLRDIEVPACGGFHLAEYVNEIEWYFEPGKEIVTFKTIEEFYELVDYFVNNDIERKKYADAAYRRVVMCHSWEKRFKDAFNFLGIK